ncbi:MAG: Flp pilus assembly protein CpaB [Thiohalomonadaceae bacterium]
MNSQQLKLFAAVTAIAALLFAWLAFETSREQEARQQQLEAESLEGPASWSKAVVALNPLPQGEAIAETAVKLVPVSVAPAEGFSRIEDVVGRVPVAKIGVGEPVLQRHFSEGSELSRALAEDERAVAIPLNEVVGVGGLIEPGDRVDVLVYVPADGRQVQHSQAQVVLERVRVLTTDSGAGQRSSRTAVLAVPAKDVPRLVLASSAGQLRLALHGAQAPATPGPVITAGAALRELDGVKVRAPAPAPAAPRETVTVYRGSKKSRE